MIISTLGKNEESTSRYPYIGKHTGMDLIIMFTDDSKGVVIYSDEDDHYVGECIEDINENGFEIYNEPITVRNRLLGRPKVV